MDQEQRLKQEIARLQRAIYLLLRDLGPCDRFAIADAHDACERCTFLDYEH